MKHYEERAFMNRYPLSFRKALKRTLESLPSIFLLMPFVSLAMIALIIIFSPSRINLGGVTLISIVVLASFLALTLLTYIYQRWYVSTYFYNLTESSVIIRKGIFAPQEITIPFTRIQDIYVDQDLFDRLLGIYDVHVSTPTTISGQRAHIDGLERGVAEKLRELILKRVNEQK